MRAYMMLAFPRPGYDGYDVSHSEVLSSTNGEFTRLIIHFGNTSDSQHYTEILLFHLQ